MCIITITVKIIFLPQIILLFFFRGIPARDEETEEIMDIDNTDTVLDIPPHITPLIDTLLSKDITDVFATEAMHKMDFSHVLVSYGKLM